MNFGQALEALKLGKRVARNGWHGKKMWLLLIKEWEYDCEAVGMTPDPQVYFENIAFIGMKTADDKFVPWLASQTDILAEDWGIVE